MLFHFANRRSIRTIPRQPVPTIPSPESQAKPVARTQSSPTIRSKTATGRSRDNQLLTVLVSLVSFYEGGVFSGSGKYDHRDCSRFLELIGEVNPMMNRCTRLLSALFLLICQSAQGRVAVGPHATIIKDGHPYRGIGVNYFDCFLRTLPSRISA